MAKYISIVIFLLFGLNSNAQLLVRDGNCYVYGSEKICDSESIEHILSTNMDALGWYLKSKSSAKKADIQGYSALAGLTTGGLLIYYGVNNSKSDPDYDLLGVGTLLGLVSCVLGTFGIVNNSRQKKESEKVIHVFNGVSFGYDGPEEKIIITYGIMNNGIGVGLNF